MSHYVIDRSKWVCGDHPDLGYPELFNSKGRMCCLGQICFQSGVSKKSMKGLEKPDWVTHDRVPKWLLKGEDLVESMMDINDDGKINQKQREYRLKSLAKKAGHTLEFTGRLK